LSSSDNVLYANIISPENNALLISGTQTTITFEFDEEAANKGTAWIVLKFDSQVFILFSNQSGNEEILATSEMTLNVEEPGEITENLIYSEVTSHSNTDQFIPGEDITLIFEFDEKAANSALSKIVFMFDVRSGEIASPLVSPFVFDIPGRLMTTGEHHQRFIIIGNVDGKQSIIAYSEIKLSVNEPDHIVDDILE
jgi:hypothetical protein